MIRRLALALAAAAAAAAAAGAGTPGRVVCLAPGLCETVFALGAGDRVVGVSGYAEWPPAVRRLPRLGGLYDPDLERLVALEPDLVLVPSPMPRVEALAERAGFRVARVPMEGVEGTLAGIGAVGRLLGREEAAARLVGRIRAELAALGRAVRGGRPVRVLVVVDRPGPGLAGLVAAGPGTYLDELLRLVGGVNVLAGARTRYPSPSLEALAADPPEVVVELRPEAEDPETAVRGARAAWAALLGARAPRVAVVTEDAAAVPGPRLPEAARALAAALEGARR